ncbi:MAG: 3-deoxy-D-manno-octulosonic acid transferase [Nitrospiraceae bacterium]
MWYLAYNIGLILASPVIFLTLLAKKRCRRGFAQRLGLRRGGPGRGNRPVLWVHAVSLGEVVAVSPLVRALVAGRPGSRIIVSTVTETGREAVEQKLAGVAEHRYAPLDFPWVVSRAVRDVNPAAFLFVETELWPNLLRALGRRGVVAILVNGRLSSHSFRGYRIVRPFMRQVLRSVTLCLTQSQRDAERFIALGASPACVHITGNIKFDQPLPDPGGTTRSTIGLEDHEDLIVAGSTHAGEEEELLSCYEVLRREWSSLVLLLAPRHIERAGDLEAVVRARGLPAIRRSKLGTSGGAAVPRGTARVVILDTRGELAGIYRHAALAFVGGTLVPVGGHNLLEPALWGTPVFFGPYTDHCAETADLLIRAGGGVRVRNGAELTAEMAARLRDRPALHRMGQAARAMVHENQGALGRSLDQIGKVFDTHGLRPGQVVSRMQNADS